MSTTLYTKTNTGKIRFWSIDHDGECITIQHGILGGSVVESHEYVDEGKQGRSIDEQLDSRVESRINKKIDAGYVYDPELLTNGVRNAIGLQKPMLAHQSKGRHIRFPCYLQRKYNGHRCLIRKRVDEITAYSRQGKVIHTIPHITEAIREIPELNNTTIDGELYKHGVPLQRITSLVKRKQAETEGIKLVVYDTIMDATYKHRLEFLQSIDWPDSIVLAETVEAFDHESIQEHFAESRKLGYEGSIVRQNHIGYEDNKRSTSLLKVKAVFDTEVMVIDIIPSRDGWAILTCIYKGNEFNVSAPGNMDDRYAVMRNKDKYLGRYVKIEYREMTADGIPFHAVATNGLDKITL